MYFYGRRKFKLICLSYYFSFLNKNYIRLKLPQKHLKKLTIYISCMQ